MGGSVRKYVPVFLLVILAIAVTFTPTSTFAIAAAEQTTGGFVKFIKELAPILILLAAVAIVIVRLPKIKGLKHTTPEFIRRRVMNWLPLGLTYAFLYMGRYNLEVSKHAFGEMQNSVGSVMMGNKEFGLIFMFGTITYGFSFLINGPLTDKYGGRFSTLMASGGVLIMNFIMGLATLSLKYGGPFHDSIADNFLLVFSILYCVNMYFQSFGAVSIVKVNASWFHLRERGVFGAIFGILISLGVYFAFDLGYKILKAWGVEWVFITPAIILAIFWIIDFFVVKDTPSLAGLNDFDTEDASSGDDEKLTVIHVFKKMLKNPIVLTVAMIEFCSGFLRQAPMQWYRSFARQTDATLGLQSDFVCENWGLLLCCAGILGGVVAGILSDRVFQSRRGPVAAMLYAGLLVCAIATVFLPTSLTYDGLFLNVNVKPIGWMMILMSMCVIGVHGMLSGTASMDFGGTKNVGVTVGIIDGFVYLGTAVMSGTYSIVLPKENFDEVTKTFVGPATDPNNWWPWPVAMIPFALFGLYRAWKIRNALPTPHKRT